MGGEKGLRGDSEDNSSWTMDILETSGKDVLEGCDNPERREELMS